MNIIVANVFYCSVVHNKQTIVRIDMIAIHSCKIWNSIYAPKKCINVFYVFFVISDALYAGKCM